MNRKVISGIVSLVLLGMIVIFGSKEKIYESVGERIHAWKNRNKDIYSQISGTIETSIDPSILSNTGFPLFSGIQTSLTGFVVSDMSGSFRADLVLHHHISLNSESITGLFLNYHLKILQSDALYLQLNSRHSNNNLQMFPTLFLWEQFIKSYQGKWIAYNGEITMLSGLQQYISLILNDSKRTARRETFGNFNMVTNTSVTLIEPKKVSASFTGNFDYQSIITGKIFIDTINIPQSPGNIITPKQSIAWEKVEAILKGK